MGINTGNNIIKRINVGSNVISRAFLGSVKIYDQLDYPTLDLNFAATKSLDPRITFTRASSGTYFDSNGVLQTATVNTPRFDHNPVTKESLGLLIEEQRTNLLTYSEQFDNAAWMKSNSSVTANATTAPNGSMTADKLVENTANSAHSVHLVTPSLISGTPYTFSLYAKASEAGRFLAIAIGGTAYASVQTVAFTLSGAGSFSILGGTAATASIVSIGNGWYRCIITSTAQASGTGLLVYYLSTSGTSGAGLTYTGNGTSGIFIWGAQLEAGAFPTSYIPTTTATATRAVDVATMTGTNFSSWYRQNEGTLFAAYRSGGRTASYRVLSMNIADDFRDVIEFVGATGGGTGPILFTRVANINKATAPPSPVPAAIANFNYTMAGSYSADGVFASRNGATTEQSANGEYPTGLTRLFIGSGNASQQQISGHIRRIAYYPRRLANTELQLLTS